MWAARNGPSAGFVAPVFAVTSCGSRRSLCTRTHHQKRSPRRGVHSVTCTGSPFSEEQTGRPPNFFGAHSPEELNRIFDIHKEFVGERPPKEAEESENKNTAGDGALDGVVGGGLHEAVLNVLEDIDVDGDARNGS